MDRQTTDKTSPYQPKSFRHLLNFLFLTIITRVSSPDVLETAKKGVCHIQVNSENSLSNIDNKKILTPTNTPKRPATATAFFQTNPRFFQRLSQHSPKTAKGNITIGKQIDKIMLKPWKKDVSHKLISQKDTTKYTTPIVNNTIAAPPRFKIITDFVETSGFSSSFIVTSPVYFLAYPMPTPTAPNIKLKT